MYNYVTDFDHFPTTVEADTLFDYRLFSAPASFKPNYFFLILFFFFLFFVFILPFISFSFWYRWVRGRTDRVWFRNGTRKRIGRGIESFFSLHMHIA